MARGKGQGTRGHERGFGRETARQGQLTLRGTEQRNMPFRDAGRIGILFFFGAKIKQVPVSSGEKMLVLDAAAGQDAGRGELWGAASWCLGVV